MSADEMADDVLQRARLALDFLRQIAETDTPPLAPGRETQLFELGVNLGLEATLRYLKEMEDA